MSKSFTLVYGDMQLPYQVQEDPKRTTRVAIHVDPDGTISVDAPKGFTDEAIRKAVQKRARWITNHVFEADERFRQVHRREYVSGEQVLYLGRRYMLKVIITQIPSKRPKLRGNRLEVESRTGEAQEIRGRVLGWYRLRSRDYFAQRLAHLSAKLSWVIAPPPFRLLNMTRQWGSCSPAGQIILNPHLVKTPRSCVDYVIVHELAHLKYHDHSPDFFRLLDKEVPEWVASKRVLDDMVEVVFND